MSDYYTESQMQRIEQAAYDGAMLEACKEWERQCYEFDALIERLVEVWNDIVEVLIERLVEVGNDIVEEAQVQEPDVQELRDNWRVLIAEWKASKDGGGK